MTNAITKPNPPALKVKPFKGRFNDGAYIGMDNATYQASKFMSSSMLRILMRSPLEYFRAISGQSKREATSSMEFGTVAHSTILENKFDGFHIQPETYGDGKKWNGNATECKAWIEAHSDNPIVTATQLQELSAAAEYVRNHPKASKLLKGGHAEVSCFNGSNKARIDYLRIDSDSAVVVDLKTCADAETSEFAKEIINRGYHIQCAWYRRVLRGLGINHFQFFFIALQKGPLPLVNVWELHPLAMDSADKEIDAALDMLQKCIANNYWPEWADYDGSNEIKTIDIPEWAYPETELTGAEEVLS